MLPNEVFALACRAYYAEQGLIVDETNGEFAHCPLPRGMGDRGYYLLHEHHQHQGLLQSVDVNRKCFFNADVKKWLQGCTYWPDGYFELWNIYEHYTREHAKNSLRKVTSEQKSEMMLKMWGDLDISVFPDGRWTQYTRPGFDISAGEHSKIQFGEAYNNRLALKLNSPWFFVANDNTKFMFMEAHYSTSYFRDNNILFPPGIIEYKLQHSTNVHLNVPIPKEQQIINLKLGMPLVSMFPLTERPVEVETKLIPVNEWNEINSHLPKTFIGRYFKLKGKTNL
jgi:hypothetical protein